MKRGIETGKGEIFSGIDLKRLNSKTNKSQQNRQGWAGFEIRRNNNQNLTKPDYYFEIYFKITRSQHWISAGNLMNFGCPILSIY